MFLDVLGIMRDLMLVAGLLFFIVRGYSSIRGNPAFRFRLDRGRRMFTESLVISTCLTGFSGAGSVPGSTAGALPESAPPSFGASAAVSASWVLASYWPD